MNFVELINAVYNCHESEMKLNFTNAICEMNNE